MTASAGPMLPDNSQGEAMGRPVLAEDALSRRAEARKAAHPPTGSAAPAAPPSWGGRS